LYMCNMPSGHWYPKNSCRGYEFCHYQYSRWEMHHTNF
jgi:hypothetical protein